MKLSAGGCYEIDGTKLRRVDSPSDAAGIDRWRERQADLWDESRSIAHERRSLTTEETGMLHTMWRELAEIEAAIASLEVPPPR